MGFSKDQGRVARKAAEEAHVKITEMDSKIEESEQERAATEQVRIETLAVKEANRTKWLPAVATVALRNTTYPNPQHGDTVRVTGDTPNPSVYRFETGTGWVKTDEYNPTAIDNLALQLAETVKKGQVSVSDINKNLGKFDQSYMTVEFLQQMAGTTPINAVPAKDSVTEDLLARQSLNYLKHGKEVPLVFKTRPKNLFDKSVVTVGVEVSRVTGATFASASFSVSDYIPVLEGFNYSRSANSGAWYDQNKVYISGFVYDAANPLVAPANAKFLRVNVRLTELDTYMVEQASTLSAYEPYYTNLKINASEYLKDDSLPENVLSVDFRKKISRIQSPKEILEKLLFENPVSSLTIKLLGDSITHGMGGTGYAENGDVIPGTMVQMNPNGYSWANNFKKLLENKFGGWKLLTFNSPHIKILTTNFIDNTALGNYQFRNNIDEQYLASFDFNGSEVKIVYYSYASGGIVEVFVDGVLNSTIDSYSATAVSGVEHSITLPAGQHKIELKSTFTKNASSGGSIFTFQGIKFNKQVKVINYAQSGKNSSHFYTQRNTVVEDADDLVIMMLGTNDRHNLPSTEDTKRYQRGVIDTAYSKGAKVILMSACPALVAADNDPTRKFGMFDVDKAIRELAYEYGMDHISNYDGFLEFSEYRGINMDTLLADGLHPSDAGYDVMFRYILRNLGLSYVRPGVTK